MRRSFIFPVEPRTSIEILHQKVPEALGAVRGYSSRLLCEFLNDGRWVYARKFNSGVPERTFMLFTSRDRLVCRPSGKKENMLNLRTEEEVCIHFLGPEKDIARVYFEYRFRSQCYLKKDFFIPEWSTVAFELYPETSDRTGLLVVSKQTHC